MPARSDLSAGLRSFLAPTIKRCLGWFRGSVYWTPTKGRYDWPNKFNYWATASFLLDSPKLLRQSAVQYQMSEPTVAQMIAALRAKAQEYTAKADALEGDSRELFGPNRVVLRAVPAKGSQPSYKILGNELPLDQVRERVRVGGVRVGHLMQEFHVSADRVKGLINDPDSGIRDKGRGWLELVSEDSAANNQPAEGKPV